MKAMTARRPVTPQTWATAWLLLGALASAALLAAAHAFETFGHYPPCELCLHQREAHWAALTVGLLGYLAARYSPKAARPACLLLGVVFLVSMALAAYHAGVEWKWWPGPSTCTGGGHKTITTADIAALLNGPPQHIIRCDEAAWRMFGLSMAGWNALASLALALVSLAAGALRRGADQ